MILQLSRAQRALMAWLKDQPDFPHGVARDAGVTPEAARRWVAGGWPGAEPLLRLRYRRGLDLNGLIPTKPQLKP